MPRESFADSMTPPSRRRAAPKTKDIQVDPAIATELEKRAEQAGTRSAGDPIPIGRGRPQTSANVSARKRGDNKTAVVPVATARQRDGGPGEHLIVTRKGNKKRRRRTVYMCPDIDAQLVGYCETEGREASVVIATAVRRYLASL
jgi:hypothetical protein